MPSLLDSDQILRIESLGDNCEAGFVLRKLGCEAGSLFRWTRMEPEQLLAQLRAKLEGIYAFENLVAFRNDMVLDQKFGAAWHTKMASVTEGGNQRFIDDEERRRKIHATETRKIRHLTKKLIARAKLGGVIFVTKSNAGIAERDLDAIRAALAALAENAPFALLEMCGAATPSEIGTVVERRPGLLRGFVSAFAPYSQADAIDFAAWTSVLEAALRRSPCPDWSARMASLDVADGRIDLVFPHAPATAPAQPTAGAATLINGNSWCRQVDEAFRLHGAEPGRPDTVLRWQGLRLSGAVQLCTALQCAVGDSIPVEAAITVRDESDALLGAYHSMITPETPDDVALNIAPPTQGTVAIDVTVRASRPLAAGERAVIDLAPMTLHPATPSAIKQAF